MNSVEQYIQALPETRRDRGRGLDELIRSMFPEVKVDMQYRMPTYHLEDNLIAWGNQKAHLAVYACSTVRLESFKKRHPKVSCGVGCVRFWDKEAFPIEDLKLLVKDALAPTRSILVCEREMVKAAKKARPSR